VLDVHEDFSRDATTNTEKTQIIKYLSFPIKQCYEVCTICAKLFFYEKGRMLHIFTNALE
jgi:hypothetical protein